MRFIVDECTGPHVASWLREQNYEVFSAYEAARGDADDALLTKAHDENWILITNDKDFGAMIYREQKPHKGVVLLRLDDERSKIKIQIMGELLEKYASSLPDNFVVATERQVRFARPIRK
jgi:predicted nuclease of predicted toxin-antitoxin system